MWAVQSAVELERMGVPAVAVATEAFAEMGQDTARSMGLVGLPLTAVGYGLEGLDRAGVQHVAEMLYAEVRACLTREPADLEPEYAARVWLPSEDAVAAASCSLDHATS